MERFEFDAWLTIAIALLVSIARLVHVLFGTLRTCIREYYDFRDWLARFKSTERRFNHLDGGAPHDQSDGSGV